MKIIQCPEYVEPTDDRIMSVWVFVGGGISNCPDWQKEMMARFKDLPDDFVMVNPRRIEFDVLDNSQSDFQIEWERDHLESVDATIFWFPFQTLCPITLFELGVAAAQGSQIFVGCHPAYERKFDVEKQLSLIAPHVVVHDNFESLVTEVKEWYAAGNFD